jgi:N-acetylneuraminic acid mutarotase
MVLERVEDDLRKTMALELYWSRTLETEDLQKEINRMARATKDAGRLAELWASLDNDPRKIAECLVRPLLVDRWLRQAYAYDERFHGEVRARARDSRKLHTTATDLPKAGERYIEATFSTGTAAPGASLPEAEWDHLASQLFRALSPRRSTPPDTRSKLESLQVGKLSGVIEGEYGLYVVAVLEKSAERVRLGMAVWDKEPFDQWWAGTKSSIPMVEPREAAAVSLPSLSGGSCQPDTWSPMDPDMPLPRHGHTAIWTGSEMIVWGGFEGVPLDSGGRYDPTTDLWTSTSTAGAPTGRGDHAAAWTGTEMLVWGGRGVEGFAGPGGRYNPTTDTWVPMSDVGEPVDRYGSSAVWTGTDLIVWGGKDGTGSTYYDTGARYHLATDSWSSISTTGAPTGREDHTAVWTGSRMVVWGGFTEDPVLGFIALNTGGRYDPVTDSWSDTRVNGAPSPRGFHTAVWTGTEMIVWGGFDDLGAYPLQGGRYRPSNDQWSSMSTANSPTGRDSHTAVWSGTAMIVWGGYDEFGIPNTGGRYQPSTNTWLATSITGAPSPRGSHTAVWTGSEMIVWAGTAFVPTSSGGRYNPASDAWTPTLDTSTRPQARSGHSAVWTGSEMIVWGGSHQFVDLDAKRYVPAIDAWTAINTVGDPSPRLDQTAVWTGSEMIVWGGQKQQGVYVQLGDGGRYDPAADAWMPTSTMTAPTPRAFHTAIWSGTEMIVWGGGQTSSGGPAFNTGGRYDPSSDTWLATTGTGAPLARDHHSAVWTGSEMVVFGGYIFGPTRTGGRYRPGSDTWTPTTTNDVLGRTNHGATWMGSRMLAFGGDDEHLEHDTGNRYDPLGNSWTSIATAGAPVQIYQHSLVWACDRALVWGIGPNPPGANGGNAYDPLTDAWAPLASPGAPWGRQAHSAVATDTGMIVFGGTSFSDATATGGVYCACSTAAPPVAITGLLVEKTGSGHRLSWHAAPLATTYDLVRGSVNDLRTSGGDFTAATDDCVAGNHLLTWFDDPDDPALGQGFWYLARVRNSAGIGSYDSGAASQIGSRDAEINASVGACP